jgi:hypothetical protein
MKRIAEMGFGSGGVVRAVLSSKEGLEVAAQTNTHNLPQV